MFHLSPPLHCLQLLLMRILRLLGIIAAAPVALFVVIVAATATARRQFGVLDVFEIPSLRFAILSCAAVFGLGLVQYFWNRKS